VDTPYAARNASMSSSISIDGDFWLPTSVRRAAQSSLPTWRLVSFSWMLRERLISSIAK
jgi:hypothetical protein